MPTQAYFRQFPPFPDNVLVAQLPLIAYEKLLTSDPAESIALFDAFRATGFCILDLQGCSEGQTFLKEAEKVFELNEEIHRLDLEEKMKYAFQPPTSLFGYVVNVSETLRLGRSLLKIIVIS